MAEPLLETRVLVKRFGGLLATDHVSLTVGRGELHAVIGPNGAGKTTLISQLAGELLSDSGSVRFDGAEVGGLAVDQRAGRGLIRSFQITNIFGALTALDNVALAVQARAGHSFRFWRSARRDKSLREPAAACLRQVGLDGKGALLASQLAYGDKRVLEIAMALATQPRLLLLDEPMAGMGPEDSARMVRLLGGLKGTVGILLVEHDMEAVFALADRITVLVYGRTIASGSPAEIRASPEVRAAYLGEEEV
jgi:branched-chain amino acid transport system ATP-binding protein